MTTFLFFFWGGFSTAGAGATLVGIWSNPIHVESRQPRITCHKNDRATVESR